MSQTHDREKKYFVMPHHDAARRPNTSHTNSICNNNKNITHISTAEIFQQ